MIDFSNLKKFDPTKVECVEVIVPWNKDKTGVYDEERMQKFRAPKSEETKRKLSEIGKTKVGALNSFYGHKRKDNPMDYPEFRERQRQGCIGRRRAYREDGSWYWSRGG